MNIRTTTRWVPREEWEPEAVANSQKAEAEKREVGRLARLAGIRLKIRTKLAMDTARALRYERRHA